MSIGGTFAAAITFTYALYERRLADDVPLASTHQEIIAGRWAVTLNSAQKVTELPNGTVVPAGQIGFAVDADIDNRSRQSSVEFARLLTLGDTPTAKGPTYYLLRDGEELPPLQPRLPERVRAVWLVSTSTVLPTTLAVTVFGESFKARDNLSGAAGWFNPRAVARVELPLGPVESAP